MLKILRGYSIQSDLEQFKESTQKIKKILGLQREAKQPTTTGSQIVSIDSALKLYASLGYFPDIKRLL